MNNFDRIKNMSVEEMAERNIQYITDSDDMPYYGTSDGTVFEWSDEQKALQHEIEWLNAESEE